jgi:secreted trypsin-like serine protease
MNHNTRARRSLSCPVWLILVHVAACTAQLEVDESTVVDVASGDDRKAIVGGSNTTIEEHPWQVSLQQGGGHTCGGSIVAPRWIVTAQHCVEGASARDLSVVAGATRLSRATEGQTRRVARIVRFPGYSTPELGRDVALLELSSPLVFGTRIASVALPVASDRADEAGVVATVSGWGTTTAGGAATPDTLKAVDVPVVGFAQAQRIYGGALTTDQLAAGRAGRDSCQGDSGGPLTAPASRGRVLIGVVSWGYGCGDADAPGLYARVTAYTAWIAEQAGLGVVAGAAPSTPPTTAARTLLDQAVDGGAGSFQHFAITVPEGSTVLEVVMRGTRGDADLYVRAGRRATPNRWDCRPYLDTADEVCALPAPAAGPWFVSVAGYEAFAGVRVVATVR